MTTTFPLLTTKLYRPPLQADFLPRLQLLEEFGGWQQRRLTLISAPAGYGKTTLVSSWLETVNLPNAWVSLDENDDDLVQFLAYFLAAIRSIFPDALEDTLALVKAPELPPVQTLANSLINDLDQITADYVLVLDDYQSIEQMEIHDLLSALLLYPPPSMHLVLATRSDPPLDLIKLRAQNRVTEIRARKLRFNQTEAKQYLRRLLNRPVDSNTAVLLTEKSEGWVTGIRLLALSMSRIEKVDWTQIDRLENNQMVEDYLMSIILSLQEPTFEECLLQTAVLERFCAPLCIAFQDPDLQSGSTFKGEKFIQQLTEANLFVVPLDIQGNWFRYHHLFRELLLRQLEQRKDQAFIASLHGKASIWFAQNNYIEEALRHTLAAGDAETAVSLFIQHRHDQMDRQRWRRLDSWLKLFPDEIVKQNPNLLMTKAWVLYYLWYDLVGAIQTMDSVDRLLKDEKNALEARQISAEISAIRSHFLYWRADPTAALSAAQQALDDTPVGHECVRSTAIIAKGASYQMLGELGKAVQTNDHALRDPSFKEPHTKARFLFSLCIIYLPAGDLKNLQQTAEHLLEIDRDWSRSFALYFLGLVHYEKNELVKAEEYLSPLIENPYLYPMQNVGFAVFLLALTYQAQGKPEKAAEVTQTIASLASERQNDFFITLANVLTMELNLRQGQVSTTVKWANQYQLGDPTAIMRSYVPELTVIKALLTEESSVSLEKAVNLLDQMRDHFVSIHANSGLIKLRVLQAIADHKQGHQSAALAHLEQAVLMGERDGWLRPFLDAGPIIANYLQQLARQDVAPHYINQILAAFGTGQQSASHAAEPNQTSGNGDRPPASIEAVEALTNRELDVLTLIAQGLSNKEIAAQLVIAPGTVTQYSHIIYQKLAVKNRRQAVIEATKLGILPRK